MKVARSIEQTIVARFAVDATRFGLKLLDVQQLMVAAEDYSSVNDLVVMNDVCAVFAAAKS